jgi:hypothetical protein
LHAAANRKEMSGGASGQARRSSGRIGQVELSLIGKCGSLGLRPALNGSRSARSGATRKMRGPIPESIGSEDQASQWTFIGRTIADRSTSAFV